MTTLKKATYKIFISVGTVLVLSALGFVGSVYSDHTTLKSDMKKQKKVVKILVASHNNIQSLMCLDAIDKAKTPKDKVMVKKICLSQPAITAE